MKRLFLLALLSLGMGCQTEYHPYDTRVKGQHDINRTQIELIEKQCEGRSQIRFVLISDTQRWYDETEDAVEEINEMEDIDFVLHTGDLTDFGARKEFELQRDILNHLRVPYVALIGNHDCIATGRTIYRKIFGDYNFAFTAGPIRFICLNTNSLEFGGEDVPDLGFMEQQLHDFPSEVTKTIVAFHAAPWSEQFNAELIEPFAQLVASYPGVQCCLYGHGHHFEESVPYEDGIPYIQCGNIAKEAMLLFTVNEAGFSYEKVDF